jgi:hypothetical protein
MAIAAVAVASLGPTSSQAFAQAWGIPAGVGSVDFVYQTIQNTGHRLSDGFLLDNGKSLDVSVYLEGQYAVTDRLSFSLGLPYVFAKYQGPGPTPGFYRPVDQCKCWHSGWQDVGFTLRYTLWNKAFAVTPSVSVGVPSHRYDYQGEAVLGRALKEVRFGVDVGQRLDRISPKLYVEGQYSYAVVEQVLDIPNNRSNAAVESGYLFTRRLSVHGLVAWQHTHGGLRFGSFPPATLLFPGEVNSPERFAQHDRLLRDNNWRVGGGASYSFSSADVFVSYLQYGGGTDTHAGRAFTLGISWPFEIGRARAPAAGVPAGPPP